MHSSIKRAQFRTWDGSAATDLDVRMDQIRRLCYVSAKMLGLDPLSTSYLDSIGMLLILCVNASTLHIMHASIQSAWGQQALMRVKFHNLREHGADTFPEEASSIDNVVQYGCLAKKVYHVVDSLAMRARQWKLKKQACPPEQRLLHFAPSSQVSSAHVTVICLAGAETPPTRSWSHTARKLSRQCNTFSTTTTITANTPTTPSRTTPMDR